MKTQDSNPARTVLTICVGFIVLYLITGWEWTLPVALVIGLAGLFSTYLSTKIDYLWMKLSWLLSLLIPNILLCIIFFFLLLPIALLSRLFGNKDPLNLRNKVQSTFHDSNKQFDKFSFEKPW